MGYYSAVKRNDILIQATIWMNLEILMLILKSQAPNQAYNHILYDFICTKCLEQADP